DGQFISAFEQSALLKVINDVYLHDFTLDPKVFGTGYSQYKRCSRNCAPSDFLPSGHKHDSVKSLRGGAERINNTGRRSSGCNIGWNILPVRSPQARCVL